MASVSEDSDDSDVEDDCIDTSVTFDEYATSAEFTFQLPPPSPVSSSPLPSSPPPPNSSPPLANDLQPGLTPVIDPTDMENTAAEDDRRSLDAFFVKVTPAEKAEADKHEFEELAAEWEVNQETKDH